MTTIWRPADPEPPKKPKESVLEQFPLPWKLGEQNETSCDIVASNGRRVVLRGQALHCASNQMGLGTSYLAALIVAVFNSFHDGNSKVL